MNISCSICAELFRGPDAQSLHVTRCGHVFHIECLAKWLERKNTCPECRAKTTSSTVIRLFVNIVDNPYAENEDGAPDVVNLQNENDNLKYRLIEKDGAIKSKEDAINRLQDENNKLALGQNQSRKVILTLERKLDQSSIISREQNNQIETLKSRMSEIDHLRQKLKEADNRCKTAELVQHLITGSYEDTEELLREGRTMTELATMVTTLKRELRNCSAKRAQMRSNAVELANQLKICKDEKLKLEEKCSILESTVFRLESKNDSKNDSLERPNNIENVVDNQSPTETSSSKRKFGEHLAFPRTKVVKMESSRNPSPSMNIKASAIAGLSPLLKRTKSSESYKLSPLNDEKHETFSILKKPRLIQNHAKKSDLRPARLNNFQASSSVAETTNREENLIQNNAKKFDLRPARLNNFQDSSSENLRLLKKFTSSSSSNKMSILDNRFRLGSLSKPN